MLRYLSIALVFAVLALVLTSGSVSARQEVLATLKVVAAPGAAERVGQVSLNGKEMGRLPLSVLLKPGRYVVEVRRVALPPWQVWVDLKGGEVRELAVPLDAPPAPATGALLVAATVNGAEVFVDGRRADAAPALVEGLTAGRHEVEVRAGGYETARLAVQVEAGKTTKVTVTLKARGGAPTPRVAPPVPTGQAEGALRVNSKPLGAMVFVDGAYRGKTPLLRQGVVAGPHIVRVVAPGFSEQIATVEVKRGATVDHRVELRLAPPEPAGGTSRPSALAVKAPPSDVRRGISSYGAQLVPPVHLAADLYAGFPYLVGFRATTGFFSRRHLGMDGGLAFRTYGAVTEVGLQTKLRLLRVEPLALGVHFDFGGGGGPSGRNSFYVDFGALASFSFRQLLTFTARATFDIYSDRHCPGTPASGELGICTAPPVGLAATEMRQRFAALRFMLAAALEVAVSRSVSLFLLFEGPPFQPSRRAFTDPFAGVMPESDPGTYLRFGVTFKL